MDYYIVTNNGGKKMDTIYTTKNLETWRAGRLGVAYMNTFLMLRNQPEVTPKLQLERITEALSKKSSKEKIGVNHMIYREFRAQCHAQDRKNMDLYNDLLVHYAKHVN